MEKLTKNQIASEDSALRIKDETNTLNDSLEDFVFSFPVTLDSVGLELLVAKGSAFVK